MRMRKMIIAGAVAIGTASIGAPATAQLVGGGLVTVNVSNVANNLAQNLHVDVSNIPVTVQVPVGIAAAVCGIDANVLAQQAAGARNCPANTTNDALNRIVQRSITRH